MTHGDSNGERERCSRRTVLSASGAAALSVVPTGGVTADGGASGEPRVIGHRGCAAEAPENTLAAIDHAAATADAVELDVRRCGTGELVVIHDATLDRVTDASGPVAETPLEEVTDAEVLSSGETVPTLREALDAVPDGFPAVLDLKVRSIAERAVETVDTAGADATYSSFDRSVVAAVGDAGPNARTALIVRERRLNRILRPLIPGAPRWLYAPEDVGTLVAAARKLGCAEIHPRYEMALRTDLVRRAHEAGLSVAAWTVVDREEDEALARAGVDAVITDRCRDLRE